MKATTLKLLAMVALLTVASGDVFNQSNLPAFSAVQSFLPYRGAVVSSSDGTYSAALYAPQNVTDVAQANVSASGVLNIGLSTGQAPENQTWEVYNYTISVPAGSLSSFESDDAPSLNINGTAANASSFTLAVVGISGSAKLMVTDLGSKVVNVNATGYGSAHLGLTSDVARLNFNSTGTGGGNITGMTGTINANMNGYSNLFVGPSTNSLVINAFTSGATPTKVTYYTGSCSLISTGGAAVSCVKSTVSPPAATTATTAG